MLCISKKMSEDWRGECTSRIVITASTDVSTFNETVNTFGRNLVQVEEDGPFFPASEDEVIGVEHLLAEPKCNNLGDDVLGLNTFSQHRCFNFEEFSNFEYGSINVDIDALDSNLNLCEKAKEEFSIYEVLGGTDATALHRKSFLSDACEDYLLDTELDDENSDLNTIQGPCVGKLGFVSKAMISGGSGCSDEISEFTTASIPVVQASYLDSTLLDKMTIDELHETFRNMFGCETTAMDKQWLKRHLTFGLKNMLVPGNENQGRKISQRSDQCYRSMSTPFTGVFNFKRKPRAQHVNRERHDNRDSLKALCSENRKVVYGFSELGKKENVHVTSKRSRKPTRRYIEESVEQNSRNQRRRCSISTSCSRDKILHNGSSKQNCHEGFEANPLLCRKAPFKGACIQVPFGQPVRSGCLKKRVHKIEGCNDGRLLGSNLDSDMESVSTKSPDDASEDDYSTGNKNQKGKCRRKHHMYWSVSEVLKLVEGVSMYGVGRWTEIKKLLFHSSANRTSVDLKDKWRNLLRASCPQLQNDRENFDCPWKRTTSKGRCPDATFRNT
ncbi:hypothetical protein U1Q18_021025 [Sarracenia purpurea var. burkii]